MIGSLWAGISGLNANATAMTVIGDNIANVNTTAFKTNNLSFSNMLSQSLNGSAGSSNIGRGVEFDGAVPAWSQGSIEPTSNPTDLAINGRGFFRLQDSATGTAYYTRAGGFLFDGAGTLKNSDGLAVQGYEIDADGNIGPITDINVPAQTTTEPFATNRFTIDVNLDGTVADNSASYSTALTVYDSLGTSIPLTIKFENTGTAGDWTASASIPSGAATLSDTSFTFGSDGQLTSPAGDVTVSLDLDNDGADDQTITWDLFDDSNNLLGDVTGYAAESSSSFHFQDGYPSGVLQDISVDEDGNIICSFSNGQILPKYRIAVYDFTNYFGLKKMGGNLYAETLDAGGALPGVANQGKVGSIVSSALEKSNVDLASEFVKMITTQRAFQANSRVITTSDEILSELINLKR